VTIAAGFKCSDGIILATDLEITELMVKRAGGKSSFNTNQGNTVAVAGAGVYDLLAYACEVMTTGIGGQSFEKLTGKLRQDIRNIYRQHIHPFYEPHERDEALQLLLAVMVEDETVPTLFKSSRSLITQVAAPYEFVGIGKDLAYYVMVNRKEFLPKRDLRLYDWLEDLRLPSLDDALSLTRTVIQEVQKNVQGCGKGVAILKVPLIGEPNYEFAE
jgi:hypothetical protein